jgi:hypothetical protein
MCHFKHTHTHTHTHVYRACEKRFDIRIKMYIKHAHCAYGSLTHMCVLVYHRVLLLFCIPNPILPWLTHPILPFLFSHGASFRNTTCASLKMNWCKSCQIYYLYHLLKQSICETMIRMLFQSTYISIWLIIVHLCRNTLLFRIAYHCETITSAKCYMIVHTVQTITRRRPPLPLPLPLCRHCRLIGQVTPYFQWATN